MQRDLVGVIIGGVLAAGLIVALILGKATWSELVVGLGLLVAPSPLFRAGGPPLPPAGPSILALFVLSVLACGGTKSSAPPCTSIDAKECAAEYEAQLLQCTASSSTRAQSEACEDDLRARYSRPARAGKDGGS